MGPPSFPWIDIIQKPSAANTKNSDSVTKALYKSMLGDSALGKCALPGSFNT